VHGVVRGISHHQEGSFMKSIKLLAAALLLACSVSTQAAQVREHTYVVGADVDAAGRITATQVDTDVPASIADLLTSAVKHWEFVPATQDGHPVPAHTFIWAKLLAVPDDHGQDELRLEFVGNGPRLDKTNPHPRYPREAARAGKQAFMFLDATVQPDGSLTDMTVRSQFANSPVGPSFEHAVLAAAKDWHATAEQVDGRPVATHMRIPVNFTLGARELTPEEAGSLGTAAGRRRLIAKAEANPPRNPLASDQPVALDSPLQPRTFAANAH
jgi:TonB family protein